MDELERLAKVEILLEESLKNIESLQTDSDNKAEILSDVKRLIIIMKANDERMKSINEEQQQQINNLLKEVKDLEKKVDFFYKIKEIITNKFFIFIIMVIVILISSNETLLEIVKNFLMN